MYLYLVIHDDGAQGIGYLTLENCVEVERCEWQL
jgi:hypothetical protein